MSVKDTSIITYEDIIDEGLVGIRQREIIRWLADNPYHTDTEISRSLGYIDINHVRPRRKELVDLGIIEKGGKKYCDHTGRLCYAWRLALVLPTIEDIYRTKSKDESDKTFDVTILMKAELNIKRDRKFILDCNKKCKRMFTIPIDNKERINSCKLQL